MALTAAGRPRPRPAAACCAPRGPRPGDPRPPGGPGPPVGSCSCSAACWRRWPSARGRAAGHLLDAWLHFDPADGDHLVVQSRVPRTMTGLAVGAALGLAGAAMQGVARNPLADPGILGVNAGRRARGRHRPLRVRRRLAGGLHLVRLRRCRCRRRAPCMPSRASAARAPLRSSSRSPAQPSARRLASADERHTGDQQADPRPVPLLAGRLARRPRPGPLGARCCPSWCSAPWPTLCMGRSLNSLALGDDVARGLGQRVGRTRGITALGVVLLVGSATALAGPIAFVGLVVPHAVRALVGGDYRWMLPLSGAAGPGAAAGRRRDRPGGRAARRGPGRDHDGCRRRPVFVALVRRRRVGSL